VRRPVARVSAKAQPVHPGGASSASPRITERESQVRGVESDGETVASRSSALEGSPHWRGELCEPSNHRARVASPRCGVRRGSHGVAELRPRRRSALEGRALRALESQSASRKSAVWNPTGKPWRRGAPPSRAVRAGGASSASPRITERKSQVRGVESDGETVASRSSALQGSPPWRGELCEPSIPNPKS